MDIEVDEQGSIDCLGKRRVVVAREPGERAARDLEQVNALPTGATIDHPFPAELELGDASVAVLPLEEDIASTLQRDLARREPDPLDVVVGVEEALAEEVQEPFERLAAVLERVRVHEVLHGVRRNHERVVALGVRRHEVLPEDVQRDVGGEE